MARENPRLRYARYCEVFAHETGGKDRWPVLDEVLIALRLSQDERRPRPTLNSEVAFPNRTSRAPFNWVIATELTRIYEHLRRQLVRVQK